MRAPVTRLTSGGCRELGWRTGLQVPAAFPADSDPCCSRSYKAHGLTVARRPELAGWAAEVADNQRAHQPARERLRVRRRLPGHAVNLGRPSRARVTATFVNPVPAAVAADATCAAHTKPAGLLSRGSQRRPLGPHASARRRSMSQNVSGQASRVGLPLPTKRGCEPMLAHSTSDRKSTKMVGHISRSRVPRCVQKSGAQSRRDVRQSWFVRRGVPSWQSAR